MSAKINDLTESAAPDEAARTALFDELAELVDAAREHEQQAVTLLAAM